MHIFLAILVLLYQFNVAHAQEIPNLSYDVFTTETIINIEGIKYRKIEFKGEIYHLRMLEPEKNGSTLEMTCNEEGWLQTKNQVVVSRKVTKRSSLFVEGLKQTCNAITRGKHQTIFDPNILVGFTLEDEKGALLKNRKIYWNPLLNLWGFYGEW